MFTSVVIGQNNNFGLGFTPLKWKVLARVPQQPGGLSICTKHPSFRWEFKCNRPFQRKFVDKKKKKKKEKKSIPSKTQPTTNDNRDNNGQHKNNLRDSAWEQGA